MKKILILCLITLGIVACSKEINKESLTSTFKENGLPTVSITSQPIPSQYQDKVKSIYKVVMNTGGWSGKLPIAVILCKDSSECSNYSKQIKDEAIMAAKRYEKMFGTNYANRLNRPQEPYVKITDSGNAIFFMDISTNQHFPDQLRKNLENIVDDL